MVIELRKSKNKLNKGSGFIMKRALFAKDIVQLREELDTLRQREQEIIKQIDEIEKNERENKNKSRKKLWGDAPFTLKAIGKRILSKKASKDDFYNSNIDICDITYKRKALDDIICDIAQSSPSDSVFSDCYFCMFYNLKTRTLQEYDMKDLDKMKAQKELLLVYSK